MGFSFIPKRLHNQMNKPQYLNDIKEGQQITMPIAQPEDSPQILENLTLEVIDLRKDWLDILQTIQEHQHIQKAMEKAYQNYQEGHKLKDFKYRKGIHGAWTYNDIHNGKYPFILTTTNWLYEYEKKEWMLQAKENEKEAMLSIENAIDKCRRIPGYSDMLDSLEESQNKLYIKYPPRISQPETWRPQNSAYWSAQWMKILAELHYTDLSNNWNIVTGNSHSIVAGLVDKKAYLLDIILLDTAADDIIKQL